VSLGLAPHRGFVRIGRARKHAEQARVQAFVHLLACGKVDYQDGHMRDQLAHPLRQLAQGGLSHLAICASDKRGLASGFSESSASTRSQAPRFPASSFLASSAKAQTVPGVGIAVVRIHQRLEDAVWPRPHRQPR